MIGSLVTRVVGVLALVLITTGCKRPYRVGEHVLVSWDEDSPSLYPAFVIERVGETRYRVHFDGYDARFDTEVGADRIRGRVVGPVAVPPPPSHISPGAGSADASRSAGANPHKPGDRVRVRWRGSTYTGVVLEIVSRDRLRVHYEGHESAWDEEISLDRLVEP